MVSEKADSYIAGFIPFADAIRVGVELIMVGPAIVAVFDKLKPASISPKIINILRNEMGFKGVVMSDDLDSRATLRGRSKETLKKGDFTKQGQKFGHLLKGTAFQVYKRYPWKKRPDLLIVSFIDN